MLCSFIIVVYTEVNVPISIPWKYPACNEGKLAIIPKESKRIVVNLRGIDNHDSGYLGMAVQLYVQAHLGHYHILT